ncbi:hypothetical protein C2S51_009797 [Perilla frutescens var. frutescens]|nr:hypothetical protein C2S51_009797 [Perilla frutescens var. frutescens]
MLASEDDKEKYYAYLHVSESNDVACDCSFKFCWRCAVESHHPTECKTMAEWMEKNNSEVENTNWILAYTKPCPKCSVVIEKNQGCNHMRCGALCKFKFCWVCLGPWKDHDGGYYECNKFKGKKDAERSRESARKCLERYTHYYGRWCSNERSRKMAADDLDHARRRCDGPIGCWGQGELATLDSVVEAWEQIVECWRVLKWSYAYGYYLSLETRNSGKMRLFEC